MSQTLTKYWLIAGGAILLTLILNLTAMAAPCGDGIKECACGDTVMASRTLAVRKTGDPVVKTVCPDTALFIGASGVIVDLGPGKLRGSGKGAGIFINGVDNVTIINGRIDNFETGIRGITNGSRFEFVFPYYNSGDGLFLQGDDNEWFGGHSRHNGNNGATIIGDGNTIERKNNEYNGFHGIYVEGDGNHLIGNKASENKKKGPGNGIIVIGDDNTIEGSDITKFNTIGIAVEGDGNQLIDNSVTKQRSDGISVSGENNVLTDNHATFNGNRGIIVAGTAGDPNASSGNRVAGNRGRPQCEIYGEIDPPTCIEEIVTP